MLPLPVPDCTITSWPCPVSSRAPAGVNDTRYSSVLISVGNSDNHDPQPQLDPPATATAVRRLNRRAATRYTTDPSKPSLNTIVALVVVGREAMIAHHVTAYGR